jgi:cytosine/adenosine deaminase-related metal-dependent hydrolase
LILSADWVVPVDREPVRDGAVVVEDGRIAAVGPAAELGRGERHEGCVILPGFVNAHSHLEYAAYAGFGDGQPFARWLATHVERKDRLDVAAMDDIARLGAADCLASGITTVGDCSFSGSAATACDELGLRAIVYLEVFGRGTEHIVKRFEAHRDRVAGSFSDRVRLGISPHAPYSCSVELYAACDELGLPLATHFAESEAEREWVRTGVEPLGVGPNGIRVLAEHGLLNERMTAAHCVHVDAEEIRLLAEHDVAVAHCPRSNAMLGCGVAPLDELRAAGLRIALGTDSPASTPSFDMFEELRTAVFSARARELRPEALTAADALRLATLGAAEALGLADEVGSLTRGKWADLIVLDFADSAYHPWEDPVGAVVLGGSPERVVETLVAGEGRYEKGEAEWHELRRRAASARSRMLGPQPESLRSRSASAS